MIICFRQPTYTENILARTPLSVLWKRKKRATGKKSPIVSKTESHTETPTPSVKPWCSSDLETYVVNKPVTEANPCQQDNQANESEEKNDIVDIGTLKKKPKVDPVQVTSPWSILADNTKMD